MKYLIILLLLVSACAPYGRETTPTDRQERGTYNPITQEMEWK